MFFYFSDFYFEWQIKILHFFSSRTVPKGLSLKYSPQGLYLRDSPLGTVLEEKK